MLAVFTIVCFVASCDDDGDHHGSGEPVGIATKAVCPTPQTLTYQNFGQAFVQKYCLRCHSTNVKGATREGAPDDHNFDSIDEIRGLREHMDQKAGAGPAATNTDMPRNDPKPTVEERRQFAEWLACNAP